jgi:hypothetical protein
MKMNPKLIRLRQSHANHRRSLMRSDAIARYATILLTTPRRQATQHGSICHEYFNADAVMRSPETAYPSPSGCTRTKGPEAASKELWKRLPTLRGNTLGTSSQAYDHAITRASFRYVSRVFQHICGHMGQHNSLGFQVRQMSA